MTSHNTINTPAAMSAFRLLAIKGRLTLELKDIKFRAIPGHGSTFTYVKNEYGFKGNKQVVYDQYCQMLRDQGVLK